MINDHFIAYITLPHILFNQPISQPMLDHATLQQNKESVYVSLIFGFIQFTRISNKFMRFSFYRESPERVNPEFIGVANKYSEYKRKRLNIESRKKQLTSNVIYKAHLNEHLEKEMEKKTQELLRVRQVRERHLENIRYKEFLDSMRQTELQKLRQRNTYNRVLTKTKIQQAKNDLFSKKKSLQKELTLDLSRLSSKLSQFKQDLIKQNNLKYTTIKDSKRLGKKKIDDFHLSKNEESLNDYKERIRKESSLRKEFSKTVKYHENKLKKLSETASIKKQFVDEIQEQIFKYRTDIKSLILIPQNIVKYTEDNNKSKTFTVEDSSLDPLGM